MGTPSKGIIFGPLAIIHAAKHVGTRQHRHGPSSRAVGSGGKKRRIDESLHTMQRRPGLTGWLFGGWPPSLADEGITPTFIAQAL